MCGCDKHSDPQAKCECLCTEHRNFELAQKMAVQARKQLIKLELVDTMAAEAGRKAELEHKWDATTRLCACGSFFNATLDGNHAHDRHRLAMAYEAIKEAQL
jgi:hypothetical protein